MIQSNAPAILSKLCSCAEPITVNEKKKKRKKKITQYQSRLSTSAVRNQLLFIPDVLDWELEPLHWGATGDQ